MENINEVEMSDINMKPFKVKSKLHPDFFKNGDTLNSQIRMRLLDIADDFIDTLEVKWVKPLDIVVTGSIVNYNWSEYSDVDVHVIYDFNKIYKKTEFVQDYFMTKRDAWTINHENLTIKGFPVEFSVEDVNAPLQSSGVYSLEKNKWVKEPKEMDDSNIDVKAIQKYCAQQMTKMDELFNEMDKETDRKKLENLADELETILDNMHDKRKEGLKTKEKELSDGNIMWKVVKHMGYVDKVYDYLNKVYDRRNTIKESNEGYITKNIIITEAQMNEIKELYAPLGEFLPTINKQLYLNGIYALDPNSPEDKRIAYAAFAEAGFENIGKMKKTETNWIKAMTVNSDNRRKITNSIKKAKQKEFLEHQKNDKQHQKTQNNEEQRSLPKIPAAEMETFFKVPDGDISDINESNK